MKNKNMRKPISNPQKDFEDNIAAIFSEAAETARKINEDTPVVINALTFLENNGYFERKGYNANDIQIMRVDKFGNKEFIDHDIIETVVNQMANRNNIISDIEEDGYDIDLVGSGRFSQCCVPEMIVDEECKVYPDFTLAEGILHRLCGHICGNGKL